MVGEALVQGGEEQDRELQCFMREPVAHPHPVLETEPHHLKHSSETLRDQEQCQGL